MAQPKRRTSKARKGWRQSHDSMEAKSFSTCPQCSQPKMPHRVCTNCGYYKGREIIKPEE